MSILLVIAGLVALCVYLEVKDRSTTRRDGKMQPDSLSRQNDQPVTKTDAVRARVGLLDVPLAKDMPQRTDSVSTSSTRQSPRPTVDNTSPKSEADRVMELENDALMDRCVRLHELIAIRFDAGEIMATKYRSVLNEVRLGMLNNLDRRKKLHSTVQHLNRIDEEAAVSASVTDAERQMHSERLLLLDDVAERTQRMVVANKQALLTLDHAIVMLTDFVGKDGSSNVNLDTALADLEALVAQVHKTASGIGDLEEIEITLEHRKKQQKKPITPGVS